MLGARATRVVFVTIIAACGGGGTGDPVADAPITPSPDASTAPDAGPFIAGGLYVPATIRPRGGSLVSFGDCEHDGGEVPYGERVVVDECVECQCTTYGFRCRKRDTCPDDRCVFVDGQVVARGGTAIVETCFDCECGASGAACRRRTAAPCPVDGCRLGDEVLPLGEERLVSECHACQCDVNAGLLCENLCHPTCYCTDDTPGCAAVCDALPCPVEIPDQHRAELPCGSLVCDYGGLVGPPACQ